MIISQLLSVCSELKPNLGDQLEYEIMQAGIVWDEDRELAKKIYNLLEDYRQNS